VYFPEILNYGSRVRYSSGTTHANLDVHSGRTSTLLTVEEVRTRGNRSDGAC
jgi:hypothetical protein